MTVGLDIFGDFSRLEDSLSRSKNPIAEQKSKCGKSRLP